MKEQQWTFSQLCDWYFSTIAPLKLKPNVAVSTRRDMENHFFPFIGEKHLSNISPADLDLVFHELSLTGNTRRSFRLADRKLLPDVTRSSLANNCHVSETTLYGMLKGDPVSKETAGKICSELGLPISEVFTECTERTGLTGASLNKLKRSLSAVFSTAVKKELLTRNPCSFVTTPHIDTKPAAFLEEEESRALIRLLAEQNDRQFEVMMLILLSTGLRVGELTALFWEDVELEKGILCIRHTLVRTEGRWNRQTPKTENAIRRVMLPAYVLLRLRRHRGLQLEKQLASGMKWENRDIVFTNERGGYLSCANLNRKLKHLIRNTILPQDLHLHSLRHTYASLLINADVTPRVVADRLGHADTKTTLSIYGHVFQKTGEETMRVIENTIFS